eukprot:scaffold12.g8183.t1
MSGSSLAAVLAGAQVEAMVPPLAAMMEEQMYYRQPDQLARHHPGLFFGRALLREAALRAQEVVQPLWEAPLSCVAACSLNDELHVFSAGGADRDRLNWTSMPLGLLYAGEGAHHPQQQLDLPGAALQLTLNSRAPEDWQHCLSEALSTPEAPLLAARAERTVSLFRLGPQAIGSGNEGDLFRIAAPLKLSALGGVSTARRTACQAAVMCDDGSLHEVYLPGGGPRVVQAWQPPSGLVPDLLQGTLQCCWSGAAPRVVHAALRTALYSVDLRCSSGTGGGSHAALELWRCPLGEHITDLLAQKQLHLLHSHPTALAAPEGVAQLAGEAGAGACHLLALATSRSMVLVDARRQRGTLATWDLPTGIGHNMQLPRPLVTSLLWLPLSPHNAVLLAGQAGPGRASALPVAGYVWRPPKPQAVAAPAGEGDVEDGVSEAEEMELDEEQQKDEEGEEEAGDKGQRAARRQRGGWTVPELTAQPGYVRHQHRSLLERLASGQGLPQPVAAAAAFAHRPLLLRRFIPETQPMAAALVPPLEHDVALHRAISEAWRRMAAARPAHLRRLPGSGSGERHHWELLGVAAAAADWRTGAPLPLPALCQLTPRGDVAVRLVHDGTPSAEALAQPPAILVPTAGAAVEGAAWGEAAAAAAVATAAGELPWVPDVPPLTVQRVASGEASSDLAAEGEQRAAAAAAFEAASLEIGLRPTRSGWWRPEADVALVTVPTGPDGRCMVRLPLHAALASALVQQAAAAQVAGTSRGSGGSAPSAASRHAQQPGPQQRDEADSRALSAVLGRWGRQPVAALEQREAEEQERRQQALQALLRGGVVPLPALAVPRRALRTRKRKAEAREQLPGPAILEAALCLAGLLPEQQRHERGEQGSQDGAEAAQAAGQAAAAPATATAVARGPAFLRKLEQAAAGQRPLPPLPLRPADGAQRALALRMQRAQAQLEEEEQQQQGPLASKPKPVRRKQAQQSDPDAAPKEERGEEEEGEFEEEEEEEEEEEALATAAEAQRQASQQQAAAGSSGGSEGGGGSLGVLLGGAALARLPRVGGAEGRRQLAGEQMDAVRSFLPPPATQEAAPLASVLLPMVDPLPSGGDNSTPAPVDWRAAVVDGRPVNFLSPVRNQHNPGLKYCGSCWAHAATSVLADRMNIKQARSRRAQALWEWPLLGALTVWHMQGGAWPVNYLSVQNVIACGGAGACTGGGSVIKAFKYAAKYGIPDEGCYAYRAQSENCSWLAHCSETLKGRDGPTVVTSYKRLVASSYGNVKGEAAMKAEIARGPIACSIQSTPGLHNYTGGVYKEFLANPKKNHVISVVGWDAEPGGDQFWIARNSWGRYWGEEGYFKVPTSSAMGGQGGSYNLGIENHCRWAVPDGWRDAASLGLTGAGPVLQMA